MTKLVKYLEGGPQFSPDNAIYNTLKGSTLGAPQANAVTLSNPDGYKIVFKGDFEITNGAITGGTVTGFDLYVGSTKVMKATGHSIAFADLETALNDVQGSSEPIRALFFEDATLKGSNDEDFIFAGSNGKVLGRDGNDYLAAGLGNAVIKGGDGDDILIGNGASKLSGNEGDDIFVFADPAGGADRVTDFSVKHDVASFYPFAFDLPVGYLAESHFHIGPSAKTADQNFIYNKQTGALSYDADGSGIGAQVQIALLDKHLKMHADNIFIGDFI